MIPLPKPTLSINSQAVIDAVKDLPRKHLGSELYNPKITTPSAALSVHPYDRFGYELHYKPTRSFDVKDFNCTFAIRVPRDYLRKEKLENICKTRNLHGSEVYTDDSDPVAVLVHSGWLRGEWPENVDTDLMDLPPAPSSDAVVPDEITAKPGIPFLAPEDRDLQITMVVLPQLKTYKGCVRYGMKSRDWGAGETRPHDGVSWMVGKCTWVDMQGSRALGRSGKARRERLRVLAGREVVGTSAVWLAGPNGIGMKRLERSLAIAA